MPFQKEINKIAVFLVVSILILSILLPAIKFKYAILITSLMSLVFLIFFSPGGIWLVILFVLFIGPLLPYTYHLTKFYEPHFGGAYPHFVITPVYVAFLISVLLLFIFYRHKLSNIKIEKSIYIWIFFSIYSLLISFISAINIKASFYESIRMLVTGAICIIVYYLIDSNEKLNKIMIIIGMILLLESSIAFLQEFSILPNDLLFGESQSASTVIYATQIFKRPAGTLRETNTLAKFLSMYVPIFLILSTVTKEKIKKMFFFLVLGFSVLALFMTLGRSAIVATILGSFFSFFLLGKFAKEHLPSKKLIISGISVIIVLAAIVTGLLFQLLYLRFIVFGLLTVGGRLAQYQNALHIIWRHFFLGVGLNNYTYAMMMEDVSGIAAATPQFPAHNLYLLYFAETGIFGIFLFLTFIILFFLRGIRVLNSFNLDEVSLAVIAGGLGGFSSILIQSLSGWGVRSISLFSVFFFLGIIISSINNIKTSMCNNQL